MQEQSRREAEYCCFQDSACNKVLPPQDDLKVFLAYPSDAKTKGYVADLCAQKQLEGLRLFPWEQLSDSAGIVFCKICGEIVSSRCIIADITYLNQNVLFEFAFGIACGKVPILIREEGRQEKVIDILQDIKRIEYRDIQGLAGKISSAVFEDFPFAEVFDVQRPDVPIVFFISAGANMPVKRSIYEHLEQFTKDCSYKILIDDPSEISSHKLVALLKYIEQSELVVCHMVGTDFTNFNEINAHVSFLAGYALGRHKRMLILQEKPADKMLDLRQVRCEYEDRKQAIKIVDTWLGPARQRRREVLEATQKSKEYVSLQEQFLLGLGHPAAEYDTNLNVYFVETSEYLEARRLRRYLFLGRRGSGKTANFLQLYAGFSKQARNIVVRITPSKLQLIGAVDKVHSEIGETKTTALFEMFWQYLILTEIGIGCRSYASENPSHLEVQLFDQIDRLLSEYPDTQSEFDIRFNRMIDDFCSSILNNNSSNVRAHVLSSFYKEYFPALKSAVQRVSEQHPIIVLVDNLDKDWSSSSFESISALINALLEIMEKINVHTEFGDCKIVVFLRTDIYRISSRYDPDFDKRQASFLAWDAAALKTLICERIARAEDMRLDDRNDLWGSVFGGELGHIGDTFGYVVARTMLRPRDILTFCRLILDQMTRKKQRDIDEQTVFDAEESYSEYLLRNLRQEYTVGHPDIEDLCIALFLGKSAQVGETELKRRISESLRPFPPGYGIDDIVRFCFETGILGLVYGGKACFSYEGYDYDRITAKKREMGEQVFTVHPGLHRVLDVR